MLKKRLLSSLLISGTLVGNFTYADATTNSSCYNAEKWYRDSAERNAIYREVYLLALQKIQTEVSVQQLKPHQWGIIMDIDETILDNSAEDKAHDSKGNAQNWNSFAARAISIPTPGGAISFINKIHALGGNINLVSNRPNTLLMPTLKNLTAQGIYFDQVLLDATNTGTPLVDKNPRFEAIINGTAPSTLPKQKILAWFGDNVQDFPDVLQTNMIKQDPNGKAYSHFGVTDFVFPNPMYGSWENNNFN